MCVCARARARAHTHTHTHIPVSLRSNLDWVSPPARAKWSEYKPVDDTSDPSGWQHPSESLPHAAQPFDRPDLWSLSGSRRLDHGQDYSYSYGDVLCVYAYARARACMFVCVCVLILYADLHHTSPPTLSLVQQVVMMEVVTYHALMQGTQADSRFLS